MMAKIRNTFHSIFKECYPRRGLIGSRAEPWWVNGPQAQRAKPSPLPKAMRGRLIAEGNEGAKPPPGRRPASSEGGWACPEGTGASRRLAQPEGLHQPKADGMGRRPIYKKNNIVINNPARRAGVMNNICGR